MTDIDYVGIYRDRPEDYDAMVAAEDVEGNLPRALGELLPLAGARVLELGCGTGRVTRLLVQNGADVVAIDRERAMLSVAQRRLDDAEDPLQDVERAFDASGPQATARGRASLVQAEAQNLPVRDGWADLAIEGWAFGHLRHKNPGWRESLTRAIDEMERALKPGGRFVLIETLGFGVTEPNAPGDDLAEFYAWLENERGMERRVIRTDYQFESPEAAVLHTTFFFGDEWAERIRAHGWSRVPECTGLWTKART
jgi:ubiquinone/menaquinone biosynthesis C-methylase UbiE